MVTISLDGGETRMSGTDEDMGKELTKEADGLRNALEEQVVLRRRAQGEVRAWQSATGYASHEAYMAAKPKAVDADEWLVAWTSGSIERFMCPRAEAHARSAFGQIARSMSHCTDIVHLCRIAESKQGVAGAQEHRVFSSPEACAVAKVEPGADVIERLAVIARDARAKGAAGTVGKMAGEPFEAWALRVEQDGIRAVVAALAEMGAEAIAELDLQHACDAAQEDREEKVKASLLSRLAPVLGVGRVLEACRECHMADQHKLDCSQRDHVDPFRTALRRARVVPLPERERLFLESIERQSTTKIVLNDLVCQGEHAAPSAPPTDEQLAEVVCCDGVGYCREHNPGGRLT